jgi:serine/threonine-protein kinase
MNPERHARIKELFLAACQRPAGERDGFLAEACGADIDLRAHVAGLLAQHSGDDSATSAAPTATFTSVEYTSAVASEVSRPPDVGPRLETGVVLAGRYRIVDLLGKGGMGEVYRAEDLSLKQTVALKFLAPGFAHDPAWLGRFRQEVRMAREVTHPNVCRVYDLGEADGEPYISMEYIDGENLKTLLGRIGRLPSDKAVQSARQLCAGLAAAHVKGVLHRDLKPANVMLDGRGQVRITDFGLAAMREGICGREVLAGTPAYMAPEQLTGKEVTARSDLYALGLVLYELFTGQPAYRAKSFAEYAQVKENSRATPPSRLISDIDPVVERIILACLEPRPEDRPASALAVAAVLPGSDLLAAALAAGQTPSPDVVAAAETGGAVGNRWAAVGLGAFAVLLIAVTLLSPLVHPLCQPPAVLAPQVLADRAREILRLAERDSPGDEAYGFLDPSAQGRGVLNYAAAGGSPLVFWYRAGVGSLTPIDTMNVLFSGARVTPADPPLTKPGMATVFLDRGGRLLGLEAVASLLETTAAPAGQVDWSGLLARAGVDPGALTPCPREVTPSVPADVRQAWRGVTNSGTAVHVEAAERAGRPVSLAILDDSDKSPRSDAVALRSSFLDYGWKALFAILVVVSVPLARANLKRGRSDLLGAWRLAGFVCAARMLSWLLQAQHAADFNAETQLLAFALVGGVVEGLLLWLLYVALEPYVRRYWPHLLVAWNRLLRGQARDAVVGGQILMGTVLGATWALLQALDRPLTLWLGLTARPRLRVEAFFEGLPATRYGLAGSLDSFRTSIYNGLSFLLLFVMLRMLLKRPKLAGVIGALMIALLLVPRGSNPLVSWVLLGGGCAGLFAWFMVRFGLLTAVTGLFTALLLVRAPLTIHMGAWYSDLSIIASALTCVLALYGFLAARGGSTPSRITSR